MLWCFVGFLKHRKCSSSSTLGRGYHCLQDKRNINPYWLLHQQRHPLYEGKTFPPLPFPKKIKALPETSNKTHTLHAKVSVLFRAAHLSYPVDFCPLSKLSFLLLSAASPNH